MFGSFPCSFFLCVPRFRGSTRRPKRRGKSLWCVGCFWLCVGSIFAIGDILYCVRVRVCVSCFVCLLAFANPDPHRCLLHVRVDALMFPYPVLQHFVSGFRHVSGQTLISGRSWLDLVGRFLPFLLCAMCPPSSFGSQGGSASVCFPPMFGLCSSRATMFA